MVETEVAGWLYAGALALTMGDRLRARELLLQVVERDDTNEEGWLWLSGAVDDPEDQRTALENVLTLNPHNQHALYGIAVLEGRAR